MGMGERGVSASAFPMHLMHPTFARSVEGPGSPGLKAADIGRQH